MNYAVLRDVGDTLKKLIKDNVAELSAESSIIFDSPADIESSASTRLSLFPYQVAENSYLKNLEPLPINTDKLQNPPLTVDIYYLMTVYGQTRETEIIVLERIMQLLHDSSVLRGSVLQGGLKETGNEEIRIVRNILSLEELNKLWAMFPNKPFKMSVSYLLTPVNIPSMRTMDITRVSAKSIDLFILDGKG